MICNYCGSRYIVSQFGTCNHMGDDGDYDLESDYDHAPWASPEGGVNEDPDLGQDPEDPLWTSSDRSGLPLWTRYSLSGLLLWDKIRMSGHSLSVS